MADLYNGGDIGQGVYPVYRSGSRGVISACLLIGLYRYLQEFAVFVFNGKSETIEMSTGMRIPGILVRSELV
jgi:hypothetical protein